MVRIWNWIHSDWAAAIVRPEFGIGNDSDIRCDGRGDYYDGGLCDGNREKVSEEIEQFNIAE